jgi:hypothetical protein
MDTSGPGSCPMAVIGIKNAQNFRFCFQRIRTRFHLNPLLRAHCVKRQDLLQ